MDAEQPIFATRKYKPFFEPEEIERLQQLNAASISRNRVEERRQHACSFLAAVGGRVGFPRRTIATAQVLCHRFHLYFPVKDFAYADVCISALLVAAKLEDTLKKLRDLQIAAFQVNAVKEGGNASAEPSAQALEYDRPRLIGIERLILETVSFNFNLHSSPAVQSPLDNQEVDHAMAGHDTFVYVVRLAKAMSASKDRTRIAFRLAVDVHRTMCPLLYPAHVLALGCLYLASYFDPTHTNSRAPTAENDSSDSKSPQLDTDWAKSYEADIDDVEATAYAILDLFTAIPAAATNNARVLSKISPNSPFEPSPASSGAASAVAPVTANNFVQIKIRVRDRELKRKAEVRDNDPPKRRRAFESSTEQDQPNILGRDDSSVRFQFG